MKKRSKGGKGREEEQSREEMGVLGTCVTFCASNSKTRQEKKTRKPERVGDHPSFYLSLSLPFFSENELSHV